MGQGCETIGGRCKPTMAHGPWGSWAKKCPSSQPKIWILTRPSFSQQKTRPRQGIQWTPQIEIHHLPHLDSMPSTSMEKKQDFISNHRFIFDSSLCFIFDSSLHFVFDSPIHSRSLTLRTWRNQSWTLSSSSISHSSFAKPKSSPKSNSTLNSILRVNKEIEKKKNDLLDSWIVCIVLRMTTILSGTFQLVFFLYFHFCFSSSFYACDSSSLFLMDWHIDVVLQRSDCELKVVMEIGVEGLEVNIRLGFQIECLSWSVRWWKTCSWR